MNEDRYVIPLVNSVPAALLTLAGAHVAWSRRFMPHLLMEPR